MNKSIKQTSLILPENKNNDFNYYEKILKKNMKFNNIINITDDPYYSFLKKKVLSNFKLNT
jgi:hypothetical protein